MFNLLLTVTDDDYRDLTDTLNVMIHNVITFNKRKSAITNVEMLES